MNERREYNAFELSLIQKGWVEVDPGNWKKPARGPAGPPVGALVPKKPKRDKGSGGQDPELGSRPPRLGYRVVIVRVGKRELDRHDNLRTACKPLVDAITAQLGFKSDNDPALHWEYGQVVSDATPGCIVSISIEPA